MGKWKDLTKDAEQVAWNPELTLGSLLFICRKRIWALKIL